MCRRRLVSGIESSLLSANCVDGIDINSLHELHGLMTAKESAYSSKRTSGDLREYNFCAMDFHPSFLVKLGVSVAYPDERHHECRNETLR